MKRALFLFTVTLIALSCNKTEQKPAAKLAFEMKLDAGQQRLNNLGQTSVMPVSNAAQTPNFKDISLHYIELSPEATTLLGEGAIVYKSPETSAGGQKAIDFESLIMSSNMQESITINLGDIPPGTYNWIRSSVAYQKYDIVFNISDLPVIGDLKQQTGTVSSFLGYNTYIKEIQPRTKKLTVNGNRLQGFWAFESNLPSQYAQHNKIVFGQAPVGATTVVNPLFQSSPVPQGSCVVTGKLAEPLVITGNETENITIVLSFSINKSLEWEDDNDNNELDFYGTGNTPNERIIDMGIRGLECSIKK